MLRAKFSVIVLSFLTASMASSASFDAVTGFSSSNPSGPWAYGTGVTGTSFVPMTVYTATGCDSIAGVACWQPPVTTSNVPQVARNQSGSAANFATVTFPTNVLLVHPGQSTDSIVTFTAPTAGTYTMTGFFELLDVAPTGIIGSIYAASSQLYTTGALTGPPANQSTFSPGGKDSFSLTSTLTAGEVVAFGVNNDGNYSNDSTGFDAMITSPATSAAAPEPASVLMLAVGFAGVAGMRIRNLRLRP